jgi:hypothetical protein
MKDNMVRLPITASPSLEAALGVEGDMRFWGTYWTPSGDEAMIDTGRSLYDGNSHAYLLFTDHPYAAPHLEPFNLGSSECAAKYILIVDRHTRDVFVTGIGQGQTFLRAQHPPPPRLNVGDVEEWLKSFQEMLRNQPQPTAEQIQKRITQEYAACARLKADLDQLARHALRYN